MQGRGGLVGVVALAADGVGQAAVVVPAHVEELHEADSALRQAAGEQAVRGVTCRARFTSGPYISRMSCGSFERSSSSGTLVCMRKAISYWRCALRFRDRRPVRASVRSAPHLIEHGSAHVAIHAGRIRKVEHRVAGVAELHPLMLSRQESAAPEAVVERLVVGPAGALLVSTT